MESPDHTIWNVFLSLLSLQNYHSSEFQQSADSCYCFMTSSPGVSCEQRAIPVQALHWLKGRERWTNGSAAVDRLVLGTPRRCHIVQQSLVVVMYREKLSNPVLQRRRETPNTTTHHCLLFSYWVIRCQETSLTCKNGFKPFKICLVYSILFYNVLYIALFDLAFFLYRVQVKIFKYLTNTH